MLHLSVVIIPIIFSLLFPSNKFFDLEVIALSHVIIYSINLIYVIVSSIKLLAFINDSRIGYDQCSIGILVNTCYLLMICIWIALLINAELQFTTYSYFKISFLIVLMIMVDGLIILSLKYPDTITRNNYLRNRINSWISEKYSSTPMKSSYAEKINNDLNQYLVNRKMFQNPDLSLSLVSKDTGYPVRDISQLINKNHQVGFREYLNKFRIEEARRLLLKDPDLRVNEVMYKVGFNSKSIFHKYFKNAYGITPNQFKKSNQQVESFLVN
jgi:AraC-like DNA-binding protein